MATPRRIEFRLMFEPSSIRALGKRYDYDDDTDALEAGKDILAGKSTRSNLKRIFEWKTNGRGRSRLAGNSAKEIRDALELAKLARTDRAAAAVLTGLTGVDVPVASAILTAMHPRRFTIIDFRALGALGVPRPLPALTVAYYLRYLRSCRVLARTHGVSLRTLDRALWQWSFEQSQGA